MTDYLTQEQAIKMLAAGKTIKDDHGRIFYFRDGCLYYRYEGVSGEGRSWVFDRIVDVV